jgi:hypothetical protein
MCTNPKFRQSDTLDGQHGGPQQRRVAVLCQHGAQRLSGLVAFGPEREPAPSLRQGITPMCLVRFFTTMVSPIRSNSGILIGGGFGLVSSKFPYGGSLFLQVKPYF